MQSEAPLDLVIHGATLITGEPGAPAIENAEIGVRGDQIVAIATDGAPMRANRTIDATGHVATPGFINVHTHAVLSMARGMTEDMGWAPAYTQGVPHAYDIREDEAVAFARLAGLEAMLFGSTMINDMYTHAHATLPAIAELGMRVSSSAWIHDVDFSRVHDKVWNFDPEVGNRTLRYGVDLADRWQGKFDGRATVMLAPHAIDTCSRDFLRDVEIERRRMGVRVMSHVAQSHIEADLVRQRDGMTPIEALEDVGMLHDELIAAHCLVMTESDIERAGRARITVAHAPKINMTGGHLPVSSKLRRAGANMALATDNMHGDIVECMRWALASGRLQEHEVNDFWQSSDVFHMATLGAAQAMGRGHDLGSLTVGKKADIVLFDFRRAHLTPSMNPIGTLVHTGQGRDVATVVIDGRVMVENGRATTVDEDRIRADGAKAARQLWTRVTGGDPRRLLPIWRDRHGAPSA